MRKLYFIFLLIPFILLSYVYLAHYYPERLGKDPDLTTLQELDSKQFNIKRKGFVNRRADIIDRMLNHSGLISSLVKYFSPTTVGWPKKKILEKKDDLTLFDGDKPTPIFTWLGHSTILLKMNKTTILIDPVFSDFASPISFIASRFQKPVYSLSDLPPIDYVLISHDHYDHLDMDTVKFFKNKKSQFIVPLGVDSHLKVWGIEKERIQTADWWDEILIDGFKFICTPSQHMSGRSGIVGNRTLWSSWIIQTKDWNLYYSGDSGYDNHFKAIGNKYGPFDYAFMENGQYDKRWQAVHLMPEETAMAFKELKAKRMFPIHWGMFNLSLHHWYDPPLDLKLNCENCLIDLLEIGKIHSIDSQYISDSPMFLFLQKFRLKE